MDIKTQMFNFCFGIKNKLAFQVHLFMHCHIKSYDRTGEGLAMDHDFIDKFGVPNKLEHFWMEGFVFFSPKHRLPKIRAFLDTFLINQLNWSLNVLKLAMYYDLLENIACGTLLE